MKGQWFGAELPSQLVSRLVKAPQASELRRELEQLVSVDLVAIDAWNAKWEHFVVLDHEQEARSDDELSSASHFDLMAIALMSLS